MQKRFVSRKERIEYSRGVKGFFGKNTLRQAQGDKPIEGFQFRRKVISLLLIYEIPRLRYTALGMTIEENLSDLAYPLRSDGREIDCLHQALRE